MSTQMRPPRTRSTGGRTLMLLGVLLALAAGTIVIYVVSAAVGPTQHLTTVIVAAEPIQSGMILSASTKDEKHIPISEAFVTKPVNADFAPADAMPFTDQSKLNVALTDMVVVGQFYTGDILRQNDARLVPVGQAPAGSLTLKNPGQLPKGDVLYPLKLSGSDTLSFVPGDRVDMLVTMCAVTNETSSCNDLNKISQTTLQNLYIYAVTKDELYVVVSHQDALTLQALKSGDITLVLRAPGDTDPAKTNAVNTTSVANQFHFTVQP